jgi:hypothetical protein
VNWQDTPIYIIARDRLDLGLRQLVEWLRRAGMTSITIIDNASTWKPLLAFYESSAMDGVNLIRRSDNLGHEVFWRLDLHLQQSGRYIVSDCDVVPDPQCPLDLVRKMLEVAERYHPAKVGPAIRIDDLPAYYDQRDHMRFCESDYWVRKYPEGDCWNAAIDTTFALYESGWTRWPLADQGGVQHVRLDFPYVVRHRPWYSQSDNLSAEERYYRAHVENGYSSSCPVAIPE